MCGGGCEPLHTYLSVPTVKRKKSRGEPKRKERIGNLRCNIFPPSCFSHSQLDTDSCPLSSAFNLTEVNPGKSAHTPLSLPNLDYKLFLPADKCIEMSYIL